MHHLKHITFDFNVEHKGATRPLYRQVHGAAIVQVNEQNLNLLYDSPPEADGAFTFCEDLRLSVFTADCLPLLLFTEDPNGPIATLHCGWRGAVQCIPSQIEDLWDDYRGQIHAILGPCLGQCCFEVKEDLISAFETAGHQIQPYLRKHDGRYFFDLPSFVISEQLQTLSSDQIHRQYVRCTFCSEPKLPSYRRNGGTDPRIRSWIVKSHAILR